MSDKLSIFKSKWVNFRNSAKYSNNVRQAQFKDRYLDQKSVPFEHKWSLMAHMHDLRVWTLAYAPS
jgi:hypothetical protein